MGWKHVLVFAIFSVVSEFVAASAPKAPLFPSYVNVQFAATNASFGISFSAVHAWDTTTGRLLEQDTFGFATQQNAPPVQQALYQQVYAVPPHGIWAVLVLTDGTLTPCTQLVQSAWLFSDSLVTNGTYSGVEHVFDEKCDAWSLSLGGGFANTTFYVPQDGGINPATNTISRLKAMRLTDSGFSSLQRVVTFDVQSTPFPDSVFTPPASWQCFGSSVSV